MKPRSGRGWLGRPVGWPAVFALGLATLAAPAFLAADPLGGFRWHDTLGGLGLQVAAVAEPLDCARLNGDDAAAVAGSRAPDALRRGLFEPFGGRVVPLFRLITHVWTRASGNLARLPIVLALASYAAMAGTAAAVGHVVAREDRTLAVALAAMAAVAASSVLEPATTLYAASGALWAAVASLAMLVMLQEWKKRGGRWRSAIAVAMAAAAPLAGPGGFAAGPGGFAYLLFDPRARCRKAAALPLMAAALAASLNLHPNAHVFHFNRSTWTAPASLALADFGLDAAVTPGQGAVLSAAAAAWWGWSRSKGGRVWPSPNPMEAAGLATAVTAWCEGEGASAVAQAGAVLFASGWWSGVAGTGRDPAEKGGLVPPTRGEWLAVLAILIALCLADLPRFRALARSRVYPFTPSEVELIPIQSLQWWRTKYLADDAADRQSRFLLRLDQAEARAQARGIGRRALREVFGRVEGPGMAGGPGAVELLALPEDGDGEADPDAIRAAFSGVFRLDPEPRPWWILDDEAWPPEGARR